MRHKEEVKKKAKLKTTKMNPLARKAKKRVAVIQLRSISIRKSKQESAQRILPSNNLHYPICTDWNAMFFG